MNIETQSRQNVENGSIPDWYRLLSHFYEKSFSGTGEIIPLYVERDGVRYDVYNITREFIVDGTIYILGRVELRTSEESRLFLFKFHGDTNTWEAFDLNTSYQDPAIFESCDPADPKVASGVDVEWADDPKGRKYAKDWRTRFHAMTTKNGTPELGELLFSGPEHMKDMRLFSFKTPFGVLYGMLLRPTGGKYEGGRIKVLFGRSLTEIGQKMTPEYIEKAQLIPFEIAKEMWLGGNQGDVRTETDENGVQHYYLCVPLHTGRYTDLKKTKRKYVTGRGAVELHLVPDTEEIVLVGDCSSIYETTVRDHFPDDIPAKNDGLYDVVFNGGENENLDGSLQVFCGVSDTTPCKRRTKNDWPKIIQEIKVKRRQKIISPPSYSTIQVLQRHTEPLQLPARV